MNSTLSQPALDMIHAYESLRFGDKTVGTPYFNNKRQRIRGALRVLVGKGTPQDIVEEAELIARREHIDLASLSVEDIKKFLVDHHLGIDCSGFVYHVLKANGSLKKHLTFPTASPLRTLLCMLRPAENTNVKTLAHEKNSSEVLLSDIHAGDMITMTGRKHVGNPDHVLLVTSVDGDTISYAHAYTYSTDGLYNHGIKRGTLVLSDESKPLSEQAWDVQDLRTLANDAMRVSVRRLNA